MEALRTQFPADNFTLLAIVLALPLLGALINGLFGKRLGKDAVRMLALMSVGGAFAVSLLTFAVIATAPHTATQAAQVSWEGWHWFSVANRAGREVPIDIAFSADALSGTMMLVVTGVGFLIHLYSTGYMDKDPGYHRYFAYLNLFIFSMLVLILGDNLAVLFIGWEGVGLCSYLLIGFWYDDETKAAAGKKAFITNRIGDFGLLVAMAMLVYHSGTLEWDKLELVASDTLLAQKRVWPLTDFCQVMPHGVADVIIPGTCAAPDHYQAFVATMVALALFLGCAGKSAQVPLYVWLPDAMAGPTPVSALIHAATMVTAGVYLVARCSFIFALSPIAMAIIAAIGAMTAILAASIALAQTDLKKVLAYSTVSQLGFMFIGVGVGAFAAGFFHVLTHAFFKGCLFLCAGSVIHMMHKRIHDDDASQDMRNMGGLRKYMPITHATFLISCLAIAGAPPLSGFWSKDEILWKAFSTQMAPPREGMFIPPPWFGQAIYVVGIVAAVLTAFYMFRAYFMTFWGDFRGWRPVSGWVDPGHHHAPKAKKKRKLKGPVPHESPWTMTVPLGVLAFLALVAGFMYAEPIHIAPLEHFLAPVFATASAHVVDPRPGSEGMLYPLLGVGTGVFALGAGAAFYVYKVRAGEPARQVAKAVPWLHWLLYNKWKVDELYELTVIGMLDAMGDTAAQLDKWVVDGIIARLTAALTKLLGSLLRAVQTGRVQVYSAGMVIGTALIGWFLLSPHANAEVDARRLQSKGALTLQAASGHGYHYRWHVDGETPADDFDDPTVYEVDLDHCETKTVVLSVKNLFGRVASESFTECRESVEGCCEEGAEKRDPKGNGAKGAESPSDSKGRGTGPKSFGDVELPPPGNYDAGILPRLLNPPPRKRGGER